MSQAPRYRRGETIAYALDLPNGEDPALVATVSAKARPVPHLGKPPLPSAAEAASFALAAYPASGGDPPGWTLTGSVSL